MRAITKKTVDAFINMQDFKFDNTRVEDCIHYTEYFLFDNLIAQYDKSKDILLITDAGWKTNTTKERLNGILTALNLPTLYSKKGQWYIGDEKFDRTKTFNL